MAKSLLLFLFMLVLVHRARADILFVDMNVNNKEVAAAQVAAQQRGEKLVVIPAIPQDIRDQAEQLKAQLEPLQTKNNELTDEDGAIRTELSVYDAGKAKDAQWAALDAKDKALNAQMTTLLAQINPLDQKLQGLLNVPAYHVTPDLIDQTLSQYDKQGKTFDSFVLSSHHVINFYSDYGSQFEESDLISVFSKHPTQQKALGSLFFWGCYNGAGMTMLSWKKTFPNLDVMVGWDGLAPEEHRAIDENLLTDLLEKEKAVSGITDANKMLAAYKSIPGIEESSGAFANFCGAGLWVGPGGVRRFSATALKCDRAYLDTVQVAVEELSGKYMSMAGVDDVPANIDNSPLRMAYSNVREVEDCPGMEFMKTLVPQLLNLIYFKTIAKNFQVYYGDDLKKANQSLAPYNFQLPDFSNPAVTRAQVLQAMSQLNTLLASSFSGTLTPPLATAAYGSLQALSSEMDLVLHNVSGIDATWLSPASSAKYLNAPSFTTTPAAAPSFVQ